MSEMSLKQLIEINKIIKAQGGIGSKAVNYPYIRNDRIYVSMVTSRILLRELESYCK